VIYGLLACLFVCLLVCLFACLFVCFCGFPHWVFILCSDSDR
jgi:hypothetical protein